MGADITAKCLRTWVATVRLASELAVEGVVLKAVLEQVARELGHTPRVCKTSYVHPLVLRAHEAGKLREALGMPSARSREEIERMVLRLLERGNVRARAVLREAA